MNGPRLRAPRAAHRAALPATAVAVLLVGLAVVAVHDLAVAQGWASGPSWTRRTVEWLDGRHATWWTTTLGVVIALLGLAVLVDALRPGRRTHEATGLAEDVWISDRALGLLAGAAAEATPGVAGADVSAGRRRVRVALTTVTGGATDRARARVEQAVDGFVPTAVSVRVAEVRRET